MSCGTVVVVCVVAVCPLFLRAQALQRCHPLDPEIGHSLSDVIRQAHDLAQDGGHAMGSQLAHSFTVLFGSDDKCNMEQGAMPR